MSSSSKPTTTPRWSPRRPGGQPFNHRLRPACQTAAARPATSKQNAGHRGHDVRGLRASRGKRPGRRAGRQSAA
jgi:hypothetical protein